MPTVAYEVMVSVSAEVARAEHVAIAEASRYLANSDTTGTFGYQGRLFEVHVGEQKREEEAGQVLDWGVGLHFTAPVGLQEDKERFEDELDMLARVESWKEIPQA